MGFSFIILPNLPYKCFFITINFIKLTNMHKFTNEKKIKKKKNDFLPDVLECE